MHWTTVESPLTQIPPLIIQLVITIQVEVIQIIRINKTVMVHQLMLRHSTRIQGLVLMDSLVWVGTNKVLRWLIAGEQVTPIIIILRALLILVLPIIFLMEFQNKILSNLALVNKPRHLQTTPWIFQVLW
jgi:hypothetical protein